MFAKLPLRVQLTLPYMVLLVLLAGAVGWLSYRAGSDAVGDMAKRLNGAIGERIQEATTAYLADWQYTLAAATSGADSGQERPPGTVEQELWAAGSLSSVPGNYVYFAAPDGRFVGVQRRVGGPALLKLREVPGTQPRSLFDAAMPGDRSSQAGAEANSYDATQRPWYRSALGASGNVWSPVYLDFSTKVPMTTLAHAVRTPGGRLVGVYGADVPLARLEVFLRQLDIAKQGIAYLVTREGRLIASSLPASAAGPSTNELPVAADNGDASLASSYRAIAAQLTGSGESARQATSYETPTGRMLVSAASLKARAGVDWWVVVALREDVLTTGITRNAYSTVLLACLAALAVLLVGATVLNGLARDIGALTRASEQLSTDVTPAPLRIERGDELGRLARAFNRMALRLKSSTDVVNEQNLSLAATVAELGAQIQARDVAEGRLRRVADSLTEGLVVVDRDWKITFANTLTEKYSGIAPGRALGQPLWDVFTTIRGTDVETHLRKAMTDGQPNTVEVFRERREAWLELRIFPSDLGLAMFFSDVTLRHLAGEVLTTRQQQLHQLAGELLTSQSDERRAIARELHDEFGQQLAAVRINVQMLLAQNNGAETAARLQDCLSTVKQLIEQVRDRALDLHPAILDDLGLGPALQWLCERKSQRLGIVVDFLGDAGLRGLPPEMELAGFRIAQEAILNAVKHSGANRIAVLVAATEQGLRLQVSDDGHGFDPHDSTAVRPGQSLGLVSMRERAEQLGGTLEIHSQHQKGTTVVVLIPLKGRPRTVASTDTSVVFHEQD